MKIILIRVTSISDRLFQVINAVFHFGTSENDVNERVIMRNQKLIMSSISSKFNKLKSILQSFARLKEIV